MSRETISMRVLINYIPYQTREKYADATIVSEKVYCQLWIVRNFSKIV